MQLLPGGVLGVGISDLRGLVMLHLLVKILPRGVPLSSLEQHFGALCSFAV